MKRIVVHVFPDGASPAARGNDPADENGTHAVNASSGQRETLRIEALLSDVQAQRLLSMLVEREPQADARAMIQEMLQKQLDLAGPEASDLFDRIVLDVERQLITQVFDDCERVKTRAAARLGIDRNTLHKKLRSYELIGDESE
jgi:DNA-binding protein Fis